MGEPSVQLFEPIAPHDDELEQDVDPPDPHTTYMLYIYINGINLIIETVYDNVNIFHIL